MYTYDRRIASGYSVRKLEPETVLEEAELEGGRTVGFKSPNRVSYAVVDAQGKVVKTKNILTHKDQYEIYPQKGTAQRVADSMNGKVQT
jgi:hypothetical protein